MFFSIIVTCFFVAEFLWASPVVPFTCFPNLYSLWNIRRQDNETKLVLLVHFLYNFKALPLYERLFEYWATLFWGHAGTFFFLLFYPRCSNCFESHMHFKSIATYHLETCDEIWMKCWWIYFYRFCIEIYNSSVFVRIGNIILPYFQLKRIIFLLTRLPVMASPSFWG